LGPTRHWERYTCAPHAVAHPFFYRVAADDVGKPFRVGPGAGSRGRDAQGARLIGFCGWYSNKARGMRHKQAEAAVATTVAADLASSRTAPADWRPTGRS